LPEYISVFESRWEESFQNSRLSQEVVRQSEEVGGRDARKSEGGGGDTRADHCHALPGAQVSRPRAEIEGASASALRPEKNPKTAAAVPVGSSSFGKGVESGDGGPQPGLMYRMM